MTKNRHLTEVTVTDEDIVTEEEVTEEATEEEEATGDTPIGESAQVGDYLVTVTDFTADATDRVLGENEFNEEPSNGVYGTVTFDAEYQGEESGNPSFDLTAKLVIDGVQYADYECWASLGSDAPTLEGGGVATDVTFCFDHPGANDEAKLFFEELISFSGDRTYWEVG